MPLMRWEDYGSSANVEDRRGGGMGLPGGVGGLGIGGMIVLTLIGWALGIDPSVLIGGAEQATRGGRSESGYSQPAPEGRAGPPSDQQGRFASAILKSTEDVWSQVLPNQTGRPYPATTMVLYTGGTRSGCGSAQSAMGPFYCPLDKKVYLDVSFFREMEQRFRAGGDFANAYVIAHEVGHHVQNVLGILPKVQQRQREVDRAGANQLSVRVELMADCLAGVWAMSSNERYKDLTQSDVQQAIAAASAIGDDRLQKQSQGYAVPDSFTHGSSEQRVRWFMTGFKSGQIKACDTFRTSRL
jgi:predicted metalloprotease